MTEWKNCERNRNKNMSAPVKRKSNTKNEGIQFRRKKIKSNGGMKKEKLKCGQVFYV